MKNIAICVIAFMLLSLNNNLLASESWEQLDPKIKNIINTPYGLIAGEFDDRIWLNPYNGIYVSHDLGNTWIKTNGLEGRGVTTMSFDGINTIYATTAFEIDGTGGIFASSDGGYTWQHLSDVFPFSGGIIKAKENLIIVGKRYNGAYFSFDKGQNWERPMPDETNTKTIFSISMIGEKIYISMASNNYFSADNGHTWEEIIGLRNRRISSFAEYENRTYAGDDYLGLRYLVSGTDVWSYDSFFDGYAVKDMIVINENLYVAVNDIYGNAFVFKKSGVDEGWESTSGNTITKVDKLTHVYSAPQLLLGTHYQQGLKKYKIEQNDYNSKFLSLPFEIQNTEDIPLDLITSYFDHEYPFLGYGFYEEPLSRQDTILNFMGIRDKQPFEYYSGHNGIDFKLAFGTPIKAPAEGNATYYFCNSCGHTIKIDHLNGYQTIFMHLQGEGLFTSSSSPIHVNEGEVIGYVGLSGKTTGPHLHLAVLKDKNNNNSFADDIPDGFIDPFSWWADYIQDPWPNFSWQDVLGAHKGTVSPYLWKEDFSPSTKFTNNAEVQVSYYNRSLELPQNATKSGVTIRLSPLGPVGRTPENLYPVPKTGTVIDIIDTLGKKIYEITAPATITIQLNGVDLANYNADTMAIYHFNAEEQIWEILDSVFDPINKIITAHTSSFSAFSVLAEKYDIQAPRSIAMLSTNPLNGWFVGPTNFTVTTNEVADKIYYKIGGEVEWKEYTGSSVSLEVPGSYAIQTMAVDFEGNYETPQEVYIRYNPNRKPTHTNKALGTSFSIANY